MNISKREEFLLIFLAAIIIGFGYYKLVYIKQSETLKVLKEERLVLETKYNEAIDSINNIEKSQENINNLEKLIIEKANTLYPNIIQEKIILEIDGYLKDSKLTGNIVFNEKEVNSIENLTLNNDIILESSIQDLVDQYSTPKIAEDTANTETTKTEESESIMTQATIEQLKGTIKFTGTYENIKNFINLVENSSRKIAINNLVITSTSETSLSGTILLEFYGIPKLSDSDSEYLEWDINNIYGKENIFSQGSANGAYAITNNEQKVENDFVAILRSNTSELSTISFGTSKDETNSTYVSSDKNKKVEGEIVLNEVDGKVSYKYKIDNSSYPKNYDEEIGFISKGRDIVINVLSEERVGNNDNSKLALKVINNTTKKVKVIIEKDDKLIPRIEVKQEGNTVTVVNE